MRFFKQTKPFIFFFFTALIFSVGCKKVSNQKIAIEEGYNAILPFPFDWDNPNTNYMPTPAGTAILVPWANGSTRAFSNDILYDYSKNDGWELVYNVFNDSALEANPYFVLYNKYRGLLRIYVYVTTNGFTTSSYLTSGFSLGPNSINSHMLNYIDQDVVDINIKKTAITKIEPTQLASYVWYASQYEIAYDSTISSANYQNIGLGWTLKWTNITDVSLGGGAVGSLKGTISTPPSQFNLAGNLITGALNATGLTILNNNKGPDNSKPGVGNQLGLPPLVFDAVLSGVNGGLSGLATVKNLMNVIFGGSSSNTQSVNLTLNADITLTGNAINGGAFIPDPGLLLGVPGVANSQTAVGHVPGYNQNMGVFYIAGKPKVQVIYTQETPPANWDGPANRYYLNNFSIQANSFHFSINPVVTNIASVEIVSQEVLIPEVFTDVYNHFYAYTPSTELVGAKTYYNGYTMDGTKILPGTDRAVVRVKVRVTPNNGAPPCTIIKTFLADLII